jgi:hypothetical protein
LVSVSRPDHRQSRPPCDRKRSGLQPARDCESPA